MASDQRLTHRAGAAPRRMLPARFAVVRAWLQSRSAMSVFWFILSVACVQGIAYLVVVPPWQHYDEPTHFEYAWLIANQGRFPQPGDEVPALRREILNTLYATNFFRSMPSPPLLTDNGEVWLGVTELGHPPLYYALVSLPLRVVRSLDILSQMYVARGVSLLLFVGTVAIAFGLMRELLPWPHPLRWIVPLALALIPTYIDVMTSVNNDAGAAFVGSLFLWGAVRLVRRGLNWRDLLWVTSTTACALFTKNTAAIMLPILLLAVCLALVTRLPIRRGYLALSVGLLCVVPIVSCLAWGDATAWYRWSSGEGQPDATQIKIATPVGQHALLLEVAGDAPIRQLTNPLNSDQIADLRGQTLTIGGWLWSDRAGQPAQLGMRYSTMIQRAAVTTTVPVTLTTTPVFTTMTFAAPPELATLSFVLSANDSPNALSGRVLLDGATVVKGDFRSTLVPQFADQRATTGVWNGTSFTNLLRNGSGEQSGPRIQPWIEHVMYRYIHRSPAQVVAALFDFDRVGKQITIGIVPQTFDSFAGWFAWGSIRFSSPAWVLFSRCFGLLTLVSAWYWFFQRRNRVEPTVYWSLVLLGVAAALAWGNTVLRPLPLLGENDAIPIARYTFPAIIATCLVLIGGLWALAPRHLRLAVAIATLGGMAVMNVVALNLIRQAFL